MVESVGLSDIRKQLTQLSRTELQELKQAVGALLQFSEKDAVITRNAPADGDTMMLLDCVCHVLSEKGVEFVAPGQLRQIRQYGSVQKKVPGIFTFLRQATTNKNELRALLRIGVRILYEDLCEMGVSVSSRTILSHSHRIPAVINKTFPGYAQAGVLHLLVKRHASVLPDASGTRPR